MPYEKYIKYFDRITVAEFIDGASYSSHSFNDWEKKGAYFRIEIEEEGIYNLQINNTPRRWFRSKNKP